MMSLQNADDPAGLRWLKTVKNKEGELPSVCLRFDPRHMDFTATDSRALAEWERRRTSPAKFTELEDDGQVSMPWP